ncbi:MAG: aldo/keto reductase [Cephaloticoccus sp.]|nr:aldo/keto reductase [Cephaloticoccus sp.]
MSLTHRHLGRTGCKVSPLCLGTMNFGPQTTEADAYAIMDRALELGINFWDTADVYGQQRGLGITESILGRYFAQGGGRREQVVLATKVFGMMDPEGKPDPNLDRGLSARKIIAGCEASLRRLQTNHLDLYQMHHVDRNCPVDELLTAFSTLIRQGKVIYVGSSNFAGWDIATFNSAARHQHQMGLVSEQSVYNLDNRTIELEVIPACRHFGLGLIPWSPLGGGLLGGVLKKSTTGRRANEAFQKRVQEKRAKLEAFESLAGELGEAPANIALAWLLHNPVVTAPIIGPRTIDQLNDSIRATEIRLTPETLKQLDTIFPGPGGEAPNAYAW